MNIYFDTEFTGLHKDTQLISIGLIAENDEVFYAEFEDIDIDKQDKWIKQNVLSNTVLYGNVEATNIVPKNGTAVFFSGTKEAIKVALSTWLLQFDEVQLVSDVCHYDMVLFIDIFGTAFDLPEHVSPQCIDINHLIALDYNISDKLAFDLSREEILDDYDCYIEGDKHNALYDAKVIRSIYREITDYNSLYAI